MATKESVSESTKCSEKDSQRYCSGCLQSGMSVDAGRYCLGCAALLCEQCLQHHNKFPSLQSHQIVDTLEAETHPAREDNYVECVRHYGQLVNSYCEDHDAVCCEMCLFMNHRSCGSTKQITDIAKEASNCCELKAVKMDIEKCLEVVQQEMDERNKNIRSLDQKKDAILVKIGKSEDEMIKRIKDIAEKSREDVSAKHAEHVKAAKYDINVLETATATLKKDNSDGVIAVCRTGQKLWAFTDTDLNRAWGLVKLPGRKLLVCGIHSRNILQLSSDGKKINELIGTSLGDEFPTVAVFDWKKYSLFVGGRSGFMHEYTISRKQVLI